MGRGKKWSRGAIAAIQECLAQGKGPAAINRCFPTWSLSSLKKVIKKLKNGETVNNYGSGKKKLTNDARKLLSDGVGEQQSLGVLRRRLSTELGVDVCRATISRFVKRELQMKSLRRVKAQHLTESHHEQRLAFCNSTIPRLLLGWSRIRMTTKKVSGIDPTCIIWADEKVFKYQCKSENPQNSRVWIPADISKDSLLKLGTQELRITKKQNTPGCMVAMCVSIAGGCSTPAFIEQSVKLNAHGYTELLENHFIPYIMAHDLLRKRAVWCEDNAPSHRAKVTQEFKKKHFPIRELAWPSRSPDLTPLDYSIWSLMESHIGVDRDFTSMVELKAAIVAAAKWLNEEGRPKLESACRAFQARLQQCVIAKGGHFE